jgi:hypothetical protein
VSDFDRAGVIGRIEIGVLSFQFSFRISEPRVTPFDLWYSTLRSTSGSILGCPDFDRGRQKPHLWTNALPVAVAILAKSVRSQRLPLPNFRTAQQATAPGVLGKGALAGHYRKIVDQCALSYCLNAFSNELESHVAGGNPPVSADKS